MAPSSLGIGLKVSCGYQAKCDENTEESKVDTLNEKDELRRVEDKNNEDKVIATI